MQQIFIVTLRFAHNEKINAIKMLRAFFPFMGLADAKNGVEKLTGQDKNPNQPFHEMLVNVACTGDEYAKYWVGAKPGAFGQCRVMDIKPFEIPQFFHPGGIGVNF